MPGTSYRDDPLGNFDVGDSDFSMDFDASPLTAGKPASAKAQTLKSFGKEGLKSFGTSVRREISLALPHTSAAAAELWATGSDIKALGSEFSQQVAKPITTIRQATAKLLPQAGKFLPPSLQRKLQTLAKKIDVESAPTPESLEEQRKKEISSEVASVFQAQMQHTKLMSDADRAERHVDRSLEAIRYDKLSKSNVRMTAGIETLVRFHTTTYYSYLKKSLELQYHQVYLARDSLAALTTTAKLLEVKLEEIKHNTGLSDIQKATASRAAGTRRRATIMERISDYRRNLLDNIRSKFSTSVLGALEQMAFGGEMASSMTGLMDEFDDDKSPDAWKGKLGGFAGGLAGAGAGRFAGTMASRGVLKKFRPLFEDFDSRMAGAKVRSLSTLEDMRQRWMFSGGIKSLISEMLPSMAPNDMIDNEMFDRGAEPTAFDNATRLSVVEVIPGWLGLIHKEISSLRAGKDMPELVYDETTRAFSTVDQYRGNVFTRAFGSPEQRSRFIDSATGVMKGAFESAKPGDGSFKEVTNTIRKIFANLTHQFRTFEPKQFDGWLRDESNIDGTYNPVYTRIAFEGIDKDAARSAVTVMMSAITKADGTYDGYVISQLNKYLLPQMEEDKFRTIFPDVANTLGKRRYFKDIIADSGMMSSDAITNIRLQGTTTGTIGQEAANYTSRKAEHDAAMNALRSEYGPKIDMAVQTLDRLRGKALSLVGLPDIKNLKETIAYLQVQVNKISDEQVRTDATNVLVAASELLDEPNPSRQNVEQAKKLLETLAIDILKLNKDKGTKMLDNGLTRVAAIGIKIRTKARDIAQATGIDKDIEEINKHATIMGKIQALRDIIKTRISNLHLKQRLHSLVDRAEAQINADPEADGASILTKVSAAVRKAATSTADAVSASYTATKARISQHLDRDISTTAPTIDVGLLSTGIREQTDTLVGRFDTLITSVNAIRDRVVATPSIATSSTTETQTPTSLLQQFFDSFTEYRKDEKEYGENVLGTMNIIHDQIATLTTKMEPPFARTRWLLRKMGKGAWNSIGWTANTARSAVTGTAGWVFGPHPHITQAVSATLGALLSGSGSLLGGVLGLGKSAVGAAGNIISGAYRGAGSAIGGLFRGIGAMVRSTTSEPYVDIYLKDKIKPGEPLLSRSEQERGVFFEDGKRVDRSEYITKPVFGAREGSNPPKVWITENDIKHGLVDIDNKPINTRSQRQPGEHVFKTMFKGMKSFMGSASKFGLEGLSDIFGMYTGLLKAGGRGIANVSEWLFDRATNYKRKRTDFQILETLQAIHKLLDTRTKDLNVYIERAMPPERDVDDVDRDNIDDGSMQDQFAEREARRKGRTTRGGASAASAAAGGMGAGGSASVTQAILDKAKEEGGGVLDIFLGSAGGTVAGMLAKKYAGKLIPKALLGRLGGAGGKLLTKMGLKGAGTVGLKTVAAGAGVALAGASAIRSLTKDKAAFEADVEKELEKGQVGRLLGNAINPWQQGKTIRSWYRMQGQTVGALASSIAGNENARSMEQVLRTKQLADLRSWGVSPQQINEFLQTTNPIERDKLFKVLKRKFAPATTGTSSSSVTPTPITPTASGTVDIDSSKTLGALGTVSTTIEKTGTQQTELLTQTVAALGALNAVLTQISDNTGLLGDVVKGINTVASKNPVTAVIAPQTTPIKPPTQTLDPVLNIGRKP